MMQQISTSDDVSRYCIVYHLSRILTTCPRAKRNLLMAAASTNLMPVASLREILSKPARSTMQGQSEPWKPVCESKSWREVGSCSVSAGAYEDY